jgi:hypothetical protein
LQRLGLAEEMTLTPLSADAVATLATAILEGTPPEALLSFLQDRAAGTPLYVTALIRGLREGGELLRTGDAWVVGSGSLSAGRRSCRTWSWTVWSASTQASGPCWS